MNIYLQLKKLIDAMQDMIQPGSNQVIREATRQKKLRNPDRQNHSRGTSKARLVMANKSNRINRQRVKRWKH